MDITTKPVYTAKQQRYFRVLDDHNRLEQVALFSKWEDEGLCRRIADLKDEIRVLGEEIEEEFEFSD